MATLYVGNYLSMLNDGSEITAKHGETTDAVQTPFAVTVTGNVHQAKNTLATATVRALWDSTNFVPATFAYAHFVADQICYLQLRTSAAQIIHKIAAKEPFVLPGYSTILPAANTTIMAGGTEPTTVAITSIVLGNYSGSTLNYALSLIL